ncbi:uncharacterized protein DMAD_10223 [Drosophila madeirensis]|uniref:Chitin-binding type-2 domain-containing protein n=2 Tax=Drosophila madeirensis TaxID=30013 RepID=A0AAU9F8T5_DROMD
MFWLPFVMKLFMKNKWNMLLLTVMAMVVVLPPLGAARATSDPDTATNATCKHATDMWGDPNPNLFYVCSEDGQQPLQLQCPQGRGFFNGLGYLGCLPFDHWPACQLATDATATATATTTAAATAAACDSDSAHFTQPWPATDPNQFYMCPATAATPLLLNCAPGKGFVATSDAVGCADWTVWRREMQCEDYY